MPFVPATDCARVEIRQLLDQQQVENVLHFRSTAGPPSPLSLSALSIYVRDWWINNWSTDIAQAVTLTEVVATGLNSELGPQVASSGSATPGQVAQESEPGNVSFCLTKRSASIGRSARGRFYVVGLPVTNVVLNQVSAAAAGAYEGRLTSLLLNFPPPGWQAVIVSYQHNGVVLTTADVYPITLVVARDNIVDSQRRRLPGRGT